MIKNRAGRSGQVRNFFFVVIKNVGAIDKWRDCRKEKYTPKERWCGGRASREMRAGKQREE